MGGNPVAAAVPPARFTPITIAEEAAAAAPHDAAAAGVPYKLPASLDRCIWANMLLHAAALVALGFINWATWLAFVLVVASGAAAVAPRCRGGDPHVREGHVAVLWRSNAAAALINAAGIGMWFLAVPQLAAVSGACAAACAALAWRARREARRCQRLNPPMAAAAVVVWSPSAPGIYFKCAGRQRSKAVTAHACRPKAPSVGDSAQHQDQRSAPATGSQHQRQRSTSVTAFGIRYCNSAGRPHLRAREAPLLLQNPYSDSRPRLWGPASGGLRLSPQRSCPPRSPGAARALRRKPPRRTPRNAPSRRKRACFMSVDGAHAWQRPCPRPRCCVAAAPLRPRCSASAPAGAPPMAPAAQCAAPQKWPAAGTMRAGNKTQSRFERVSGGR
ncbi:hypothetical protein JKP88DRAFT_304144 [Tribonema minus]|uniref:Uncharacterized protein n=1 Tax=Tribonema minus TaxID=303371 RepID=A0A835Z7H8_9STRA|nr:hypothetical protein JKP88DRAFT_304144 [Tribonema minus]